MSTALLLFVALVATGEWNEPMEALQRSVPTSGGREQATQASGDCSPNIANVQGAVTIELSAGACPGGIDRAQLERSLNQALASLLAKLRAMDSATLTEINKTIGTTIKAEMSRVAQTQAEALRHLQSAVTEAVERASTAPSRVDSRPDKRPALFVECNLGSMPSDTGPNNRIYVLNVFPTPIENGGGGLGEYYKLDGRGDLKWPRDGKRPWPAHQCKLTNYGPETMLNVWTSVQYQFLRGVADKGNPSTIRSGDLFLERDWPFLVTKIEPGAANAFVFYIAYMGTDFVQVTLPQKAEYQVPGDSDKRSIAITQPSPTGDATYVSLAPFIPD